MTKKYPFNKTDNKVIPGGRFDLSSSLPSSFPVLPKYASGLDTTVELNSGANKVQELVDYLSTSGGGTVKIRSGSYTFDRDLTIPSNVSIEGDSFGAVTFIFNGQYGIRVSGTQPYSTGTIAINNGSRTVTGTGTAWTTNLTLGHKIKIGGLPYSITAITSDTSLTISNTYFGDTITGVSYLSAIFAEKITIENIIVIAPASTAMLFNYSDLVNVYNVIVATPAISGIMATNSSRFASSDTVVNGAGSNGYSYTNTDLINMTRCISINCGGNGIALNTCTQAVFLSCPANSNVGDGYSITGGKNIAWLICDASQNGGNGISIAGDTTDGTITGSYNSNTGDGIKLAGTVARISIGSGAIARLNTGYGVDVSVAGVTRTTIIGNQLTNNTAGTVLNNGTNTINANNQV